MEVAVVVLGKGRAARFRKECANTADTFIRARKTPESHLVKNFATSASNKRRK